MRTLARILTVGILVLGLRPAPARAQYMFLDSNGDGVNTAADIIDCDGVTTVDIWLHTDANKDGSPATCLGSPETPLSIFSYEVILRVVNGTVAWGPMDNYLPIDPEHGIVNFASWQDTTGTTGYHNGWGGRDNLPPGLYHIARLTLRVTSGHPSIFIASSLPPSGTSLTSFGTMCPGPDEDGTCKLGQQWSDADGIGPPVVSAGGPYGGVVGRAVAISAVGTTDPHNEVLTYAWDFGDGGTGEGAQAAHVYAQPGRYTVTLIVDGGAAQATAIATIAPADQVTPVADAGGPYHGTTKYAIQFDGSRSFDPNGDALRCVWQFGDGDSLGGVLAMHRYSAPGTYDVTLTVNDGAFSSTATTIATIVQAINHAPFAAAGGPYAGVVGRTVQFDGSASSDPDSDPLTFRWDFGDGRWGLGTYGHHAYASPGSYQPHLSVTDGIDTTSAAAVAVIAAALPARVFTVEKNATFDPNGNARPLQVQIEPVEGSFALPDVDLNQVELRSPGTGSVPSIDAYGPVSYAGDDTDGNGIREVTAFFLWDDLLQLFGNVTQTTPLTVEVDVHLAAGGIASGTLGIEVIGKATVAAGALEPARVSPNPLNPSGTLSFETRASGRVRAEVFDLQGRLVRVLVDETTSGPRKYRLRVGGAGGGGEALASGVYFYRVATAEGMQLGRFAVLK